MILEGRDHLCRKSFAMLFNFYNGSFYCYLEDSLNDWIYWTNFVDYLVLGCVYEDC